jgi:Zn-dependent M28 family amino/carboxypeptidase
MAAQAEGPTKETSAWWGHIKVLASDDFQGRLTGSPGYQKAAAYVADSFHRFGLMPAGQDGYLQAVAYDVQTVLPDRSQVSLIRPQGTEHLNLGDDLVLWASRMQRSTVTGPLIFVGYGIHMPEAGYDDFESLPVKGAIIVCIVGGPQVLTGPQRAHAFAENLPHYLEEAGALGAITIIPTKNLGLPWSRVKATSVQPGMLLEEVALRPYKKATFAALFNEKAADKLFAGTGHTYSELAALADANKPLPRFPLKASLDAKIAVERSQATAGNVIARLPGSDPDLSKEAIVLSAHLDHLGTGAPDHGDGIYHGAMDDASGVASLLEVARAMHDAAYRPRRSILFLAVSGEEKGLLGSRYFAAHPTWHAGPIVADLNTDMFLPLFPLTRLVGFGAEESSLGDDARAIGKALGVELVPDPAPDHLIFVRADQYSFVRKGIPALMLAFSPRPGTPEVQAFADFWSQRYHAQADDLNQPVDLAAAEAFDAFLLRLSMQLADAPTRPVWHRTSFFARFAQAPLP